MNLSRSSVSFSPEVFLAEIIAIGTGLLLALQFHETSMKGSTKKILIFLLTVACAQAAPEPNILFIAIDDMNDWTGFLGGHPQAITPNMDKLAKKGVNTDYCFAKAYDKSKNIRQNF